MVAHGAFAHIGGGGNLLVVEATGDELGDFELAVGQAGKGRGPAGRARLDARSVKIDVLDRLSLEHAFAVHDLRQRRRNGGDIGFDQVAAGAQFERRHNVLVIRECRQKHHARRRVALKDLACRRKTVPPRHLNVEQCDIGRVFGIERNRIVAVGAGAHYLDLRLGAQDNLERIDHQAVVVDNDEPHQSSSPCCLGTVANTRQPPVPTRGPAVKVPPSASMRSRMEASPMPSAAPRLLAWTPPVPSSVTMSW